MHTAVVADDDVNIREGLGVLIDWEEYGFSIVGKAENGRQALRLADELNPDLMVVDIRMPGLDGLSVIRTLRESGRSTHCLIISAYDDFEYAREALRHGVDNYLVKPVDPDELRESLLAIAAKMGASTPDYVFRDGGSHKELRSHVLRRLLTNAITPEELDERFRILGLRRRAGPYRCVTLRRGTAERDALATTIREMESAYTGWTSVCFADGSGLACAVLAECSDVAELERRSWELARGLSSTEPPAVAALGPPVARLVDVHRSFKAALTVLSCLVAHPHHEVLHAPLPANNEEHTGLLETDALLRALTTLDEDALERYFERLNERLDGRDEPGTARGVSLGIGGAYAAYLRSRDTSWERVLRGRSWPISSSEPQPVFAATSVLLDIGRTIIEHLRDAADGSGSTATRLIALVRTGITDPNLCLKSLSHSLGVSPAYAGQLFYQETGVHFSHFVNNRRIALAVKKMEQGITATSSLASAVGFSDPKYFSKVFRRVTGHSPTQYRRKISPPL
jgi:two-component system response regulator YesN